MKRGKQNKKKRKKLLILLLVIVLFFPIIGSSEDGVVFPTGRFFAPIKDME